MSELHFDAAPKNGKSVVIKPSGLSATPFVVEVWIDGTIFATRLFVTAAEAEKYQREEVNR